MHGTREQLFACEDIEEGTVVAGFGAVRQLREGEEARRTRLGYSFIVKEREGKALTITPKHGVTEGCMAHAINHTCHPGFVNCRFVHAGIVGGWSEDEQGGIGGRTRGERCRTVCELWNQVPVCWWVCVPFVSTD